MSFPPTTCGHRSGQCRRGGRQRLPTASSRIAAMRRGQPSTTSTAAITVHIADTEPRLNKMTLPIFSHPLAGGSRCSLNGIQSDLAAEELPIRRVAEVAATMQSSLIVNYQ